MDREGKGDVRGPTQGEGSQTGEEGKVKIHRHHLAALRTRTGRVHRGTGRRGGGEPWG